MKSKDIQKPFSDGALEMWVNFANKFRMEIGVTLQIHGIIVAGTITSGAEFLQYVGNSLSKAALDADKKLEPIAKAIQDIYKEMAEDLYPIKKLDEAETSETESIPISFIHLREAKLWNIHQQQPITMKYWRGRLDSIDGWTIGILDIT